MPRAAPRATTSAALVFGQVDEGRHTGVDIAAELARGFGRVFGAGVFAGQEAASGEGRGGDPIGIGGGKAFGLHVAS